MKKNNLTFAADEACFPWLLLCPDMVGRDRRILCLGIDEADTALVSNLSDYFSSVFLCSFKRLLSEVKNISPNVVATHLCEDISVLPYEADFFDVVIIGNCAISGQWFTHFLPEIFRVIRPDGCLFFCFSNKMGYHRVKRLLSFYDRKVGKEKNRILWRHNVLSCRHSLMTAGFSNVHLFSFSPDCSKPSTIRDCTQIFHSANLHKPFVSIKSFCLQFLKKRKFVRNFLEPYYGVVAGGQSGIFATIPCLIAREMNKAFSGTSWEIWGDTFNVTAKGTFIFKLFDAKEKRAVICKIPLSAVTRNHLDANFSALKCTHDNEEIPLHIKEKIPLPVTRSEVNGRLFYIEELKEGIPAVQYRYKKNVYDNILYNSSKIITAFHKSTLFRDEYCGRIIIDTKVKALSRYVENDNNFIVDLKEFLLISLGDFVMFVSSKGDCSANNVIVDSKKKISGIIDWDQAQKVSFPVVDIINLLESFRRNFENKPMGQVVKEAFFEEKRSELENSILKEYCGYLSFPIDDFVPFAVLYWIDHVISQEVSSFAHEGKWIKNNVLQVVDTLKTYF